MSGKVLDMEPDREVPFQNRVFGRVRDPWMIKFKITVEIGGIGRVVKLEDWVGLEGSKSVCVIQD